MSYKNRWDNGAWKVICDACGREFKNNELQLRWDGLMVCSGDWEPRQPQDFVHGVADKIVPPFTRSEPEDTFAFVCTLITTQGIADYGQADCARADTINTGIPVCTLEGTQAISFQAIAGCSVAGKTAPNLNEFLIG
jgi:hypothetical protein